MRISLPSGVLTLTFLAALLAGCGGNVPEGYHDTCETTADCTGDYECLLFDEPDTGISGALVCTQTCETASDCPKIRSSHCGDQTVCEDGVCGFWGCK